MRDLTTYEDYDIDDLYKPINHLTVINNVSKNSRIVLYTLLELNKESVLVQELFDLVKKKLFIFKKAPLFELINEFVDHKIIKIIDNEIIQLMVNKKEVAFILNNKKIE
ncbi:origin recognition complex subunit 2 [Vairimorpha apis BRL 01]|uniref:Origin recognition complex subunit 2 n=1 Tax=Vairimorpha apis BRL 01 TaxID=1037528 RepID=T0L2C6_9MICR|nr:origin recognition complex subunit 2 [Vairimorpha apis BRL 01]